VMEALWDCCGAILCLTLRTRPERRRAAEAQFAAVGLTDRVVFLTQDLDAEDGKRGCFAAHQHAARFALDAGVQRVLIFEDDVEFLPHFTPHSATRAAAFLHDTDAPSWSIFLLGHFPRKMELTATPHVVRVRSMDGHAYILSVTGMQELCALTYAGDQIDVHFHYQNTAAFALYPMVAVQTPGASDTEGLERPEDWNDAKLKRERDLYEGCVRRKALATAMSINDLGTAGPDSSCSSGSSMATLHSLMAGLQAPPPSRAALDPV